MAEIDGLRNEMTEAAANNAEPDYQSVFVSGDVICNTSLDVIKTVSEFDFNQSNYVFWR